MKIELRRSRAASRGTVALLAMGLAHCGIEVGNPHGGKKGQPSSGLITISLADAPIDDVKHVFFDVQGLQVASADATNAVSLSLTQSGKIDALALNSGKTLALASGQSIAPGTYHGLNLVLNQNNPATVVNNDDSEAPVDFSDSSHAIYVPQTFSIAEGQTLELVMHIDLRRSLSRMSDGDGPSHRFAFGPTATVLQRDSEATIVGKNVAADVTTVCAYLTRRPDFQPGHRTPPFGGNQRQGHGDAGEANGDGDGPPDGPPPPGAFRAHTPNSFDPDAKVALDTDATCPQAFAVAGVATGAFDMSHLWPGSYRLRFFRADGTFTDGAFETGAALSVDAGATVSFDYTAK